MTPQNPVDTPVRRCFAQAALMLVSALLFVSAFLVMPPASAARAAEFSGFGYDSGVHYVGALRHNTTGELVFCLELGKETDDTIADLPLHPESESIPGYSTRYTAASGASYTFEVPALGGRALQDLTYVLGRWGRETDDATAAAVQIAIWEIRAEGATGDYRRMLGAHEAGLPGGVVELAHGMVTEARAFEPGAGGAPPVPPVSEPIITADAPYSGYVSVPEHATELTLTNAVFEQTGSSRIAFPGGAPAGTTAAWRGVPPHDSASWADHYRVGVSGEYAVEVVTSVAGRGELLVTREPVGSSRQSLGVATPPRPTVVTETVTGEFEGAYTEPSTRWAPQVTTEVPSYRVEEGERFSDRVTLFAAPGAEWRWAENRAGERRYAPTTASGTLYGPFADDPARTPSQSVPAGAPIAGTAEVTTAADRGPGTYEVEGPVARASGFYTWVWNIEFERQPAAVRSPAAGGPSIPDGYFFTDGFGQASEGQMVPVTADISTRLDREAIASTDLSVVDLVSVSARGGEWVTDGNGAQIPAEVRLTVYGVEGTPRRQAGVPAGAEEIARTSVTATPAGGEARSAPIPLPESAFHRFDGITVRACVLPEDQPIEWRRFFTASCDDFGVPSESARFVWHPELTTRVPYFHLDEGDRARFADQVTFFVRGLGPEQSDGAWKRERAGGGHQQIVARGTLYGPFAQPTEFRSSAEVPTWARSRVADTATATAVGPGAVAVEGVEGERAAGYYTWVWEIDAADQRAEVRRGLPEGYRFADRFGAVDESQHQPMTPVLSTRLDRETIVTDELAIVDAVTVDIANGDWSRDETGSPIPANVRLTVYGTDDDPERRAEAPEGAEVVATGFVTVSAEGVATPSGEIGLDPEAFYSHEAVTVQACILHEDQPEVLRGFWNERCDDWGVPSETAEFEWAPVVSTQAERFIEKGERFSDVLTFTALPDGSVEDAIAQQWRKAPGGAEFDTVTARGIVYGPFDRDPEAFPAERVPAWAAGRIAARAEFTTSPEQGPGDYTVRTIRAPEAGYYTWVWSIDAGDQTERVARTMPDGYRYSDGFGTAGETQVVKTSLALETDLDREELTITDLAVRDETIARLYDGQWLLGETGERVPATVRLTVYGTDGEARQQAEAPSGAAEIARGSVMMSAADEWVMSDPIRIPIAAFREHEGLTVQACIHDEDQPEQFRGYIAEACDDWGVPAESAVFVKPEVTTRALERAGIWEEIYDIGILSGSNVPEGSTMGFTAYLEPVAGQPKYDENWQRRVGDDGSAMRWTEEEIAALDDEALCLAQPVATTERVPIREVGEYRSPSVTANSFGTVNWVEDTRVPDPDEPGGSFEWSRGVCGEADEVTEIVPPRVATEVHLPEAFPGDVNWDSVIVEGLGDVAESAAHEFEATVKVYENEIGARRGERVCTPENLVLELGEPIAVSGSGTFLSAEYEIRDEWRGKRLDHVETLWMVERETGERVLVHEGECGAESESTVVPDPRVTTEVQHERLHAGDENWDNLVVEGLLDDTIYAYEATVEVFLSEDPDAPAVCESSGRVLELGPTEVAGNGRVESQRYTIRDEWVGARLDHVESLWRVSRDGERTLLHTGACGATNESSWIDERPALAITGATLALPLFATGASALLLGALLLGARVRRAAVGQEGA